MLFPTLQCKANCFKESSKMKHIKAALADNKAYMMNVLLMLLVATVLLMIKVLGLNDKWVWYLSLGYQQLRGQILAVRT